MSSLLALSYTRPQKISTVVPNLNKRSQLQDSMGMESRCGGCPDTEVLRKSCPQQAKLPDTRAIWPSEAPRERLSLVSGEAAQHMLMLARAGTPFSPELFSFDETFCQCLGWFPKRWPSVRRDAGQKDCLAGPRQENVVQPHLPLAFQQKEETGETRQ